MECGITRVTILISKTKPYLVASQPDGVEAKAACNPFAFAPLFKIKKQNPSRNAYHKFKHSAFASRRGRQPMEKVWMHKSFASRRQCSKTRDDMACAWMASYCFKCCFLKMIAVCLLSRQATSVSFTWKPHRHDIDPSFRHFSKPSSSRFVWII